MTAAVWRRMDWRWFPVALLWLPMLALALALYLNHPNGAGDYGHYYRGAQRILSGTGLYTDLKIGYDYIGPPLVVQVVTPLVALGGEQGSKLAWFALNVLALIGTLALLSRYIPGRGARLVLWAVVPLFTPTLMTFWLGQITILLLALTVCAWAAYRDGHPALAGALLAVAVWTKFYPGLLIVYFVWKREWRVVFSAMAATALVIGFQMLTAGVDGFIYYMTEVLPLLVAEGEPQLAHSNNAILGFAQRLFADAPQVTPLFLSPLLFTLTRLGLTLGLPGATAILISRPVRMSQTALDRFDLEYSLVLLVALLLGSTLGLHGMLSLLLVYTVLLNKPQHMTPRHRRRLKQLVLVSAVLVNLHLFLILGYLQPPSDNVLPALALSLPFFGMLLAWGLTAGALLRQPAQVVEPSVNAAPPVPATR